jgi:eukaryotic-like serine/threonine-protein kinase
MSSGTPSMRLEPGQVLNGKYRVVRLLGDGGMGSVYEVHHEVLGTRVALKLLHGELSRTGMAKRFLQEARASARIKSPHVVAVLDADQTADGFAFIVLEYLLGKTLRELYEELDRERRRLPFEDALDFAMQMFEGVEAAHAAGIVHRDLKPDNVMISTDAKGARLLKLLDFGIAKVDEPPESMSGPALTRPGALLGTPEYMAPEQVYSAGTADARSDVFSLGVILFEMLSARRPVDSDDPQQIAVSYLTNAITRLEQVCPGVPAPLAAAVHRAIAPQPRDRFPSVAEFRAAIEPFAPVRPSLPSRLSNVGPLAATARPIPETRADGFSATVPGPGLDGAAASSHPEASHPNRPGSPASSTPLASVVAVPPPSPGFTPEYPSAGVPFSVAPPRAATPSVGGTTVMPSNAAPATVGDALPTRPPAPNPFGAPLVAPLPYAPPPYVPPIGPAGYPQVWAPPAPAETSLGSRPVSRRTIWIVAGALAFLTVVAITLGTLYALGWLDDEPDHPRKPAKHQPHRPGAH